MVSSIRGFSGEVKEVDPKECDDETAEEGKGISAVGGIKSLEKDQRSHDRCTRESNIIHRVHTAQQVSGSWQARLGTYTFVENVSRALLK